MTKSIEEQAEGYASEDIEMMLTENTINFGWLCKKQDFLAGAKARDAQYLAVVNELREASKFYGNGKNWQNFDLELEVDPDCEADYEHLNPERPRLITGGKKARQALTKADQMLKEMGIKL